MEQDQFNVRLNDGRQFGPASMDIIVQWAREGRIPADALLVPAAAPPESAAVPVLSHPLLQQVLQAPPTVGGTLQQPPSTGGEAPLSGMIPYKNPPALIGYYVSIGSLIPFVGAVAGPTAIVLGIIGMRRRLAKPEVRGLAHAWIAIIVGVIGTLISVGCVGSYLAVRGGW